MIAKRKGPLPVDRITPDSAQSGEHDDANRALATAESKPPRRGRFDRALGAIVLVFVALAILWTWSYAQNRLRPIAPEHVVPAR